MMRTFLLTCFWLFYGFLSYSQDFQGYRSGNYQGVNGVFSNPANIADSRFYLDVNLLSVSTLGANDKASYKLNNFSETFKSENLRKKLFGERTGPASGLFNLDIRGPSVMLEVGLRNSVALTTRARVFANVTDFDSKLFEQLVQPVSNDPSLPYTISSDKDMRFSLNGWTEYGASFARVLIDNGTHAVKGGLTLKYLAGSVNGYVNVNRLNATINADPFIELPFFENSTGTVITGFSGERVAGLEAKEIFKMNGSGFGTDLGFVYEYRPDSDMQTTDGVRLEENYQRLYKFKFGISLLDIGSISYRRDHERSSSYALDITDEEQLYLREFSNLDVDDYNKFFAERPQYFIPLNSETEDSYIVSLPATLQVEADYLLQDGWYLNLASQIGLSNNKTKFFNNKTYSGVTLTPRYEDRLLGISLPVNYNSLTKMNVGLSLRFGPLFIGSGSVFTALFGSSKQADVHFGLRFGELK